MTRIKSEEFFGICLIVVFIVATTIRLGMTFPFVFINKSNLNFQELDGWVRIVQEKGPGSSFIIQFKKEKDSLDSINLVCDSHDTFSVLSSKCGIASQLLDGLNRSTKTTWQNAKITAADLDFGFINNIAPKMYLSKEIILN